MEESTSREKILKKVRKALVEKGNSEYLNADFTSPLFTEESEIPEIIFAKNFIEQKGNFIFCRNDEEAFGLLKEIFIQNNWNNPEFHEEEIFYYAEKAGINKLNKNDEVNKISITLCECLVASTGSILISSAQEISTRLTVNCKIHIVIAFTSQIVNTISDSLQYIEKKYLNNQPRQLTYITGASKTADIEQQLVYGAHGPKEIFCFLIEN